MGINRRSPNKSLFTTEVDSSASKILRVSSSQSSLVVRFRKGISWSRTTQLYILIAFIVISINLIGISHHLEFLTLCDTSTGFSSFRQRPIMVQIEGTTDVIRTLQLEAKPIHLIKRRKNRYWVKHRVYAHVQVKELEDGCVHLGEWMKDIASFM